MPAWPVDYVGQVKARTRVRVRVRVRGRGRGRDRASVSVSVSLRVRVSPNPSPRFCPTPHYVSLHLLQIDEWEPLAKGAWSELRVLRVQEIYRSGEM